MGFSLDISIPALTVFAQGLLSFFSPCVLPLLPVYFAYLSGGTAVTDEEGVRHYDRKKVLVNTLFFVLGIAFAFFLLGLGMTAVGIFFGEHRLLLARIGGVIVILFGLYQLGVFGSSAFLSRERRLPLRLDRTAMSPLAALLLGFLFSFAWTPCVGPALSSVLLMAASASSRAAGFILIGVYTLGFVLPFLAAGLFTTSLLALLRRHRNVVRYTVKIGGVLLILMGVMMVTGLMNNLSGYLAGLSPATEQTDASQEGESDAAPEEAGTLAATDFTLTDQYGVTHRLSDYRGKVVFLNFWATWCPPCRAEMPDIQALYEQYQQQEDSDVVILGVAAPYSGRELDTEGIADFLAQNGYTYPVVMDEGGGLFSAYRVSAIPTTFMIDRNGNIFGYVTGGMSADTMRRIIEQTLAAD